ncbi:DUF3265 domain-containing protein [Vibrio parahaemolyticus]|nr:DUF3265 domain-containing protein [Vibrio parahaemolyticus]
MYTNGCKTHIKLTRRLRGIHAAWHFWFTVSFGGEGGLRKVVLCGIHPLTRRYVLITKDQLVASFLCFLGFLILVLSAS